MEPALTWPGHAGVWHFNDAYPTNAADSSANHYDAIATNADNVTQIDGKVGKTYYHPTANPYKTGITVPLFGGVRSVHTCARSVISAARAAPYSGRRSRR